jgi:hypothetical protein
MKSYDIRNKVTIDGAIKVVPVRITEAPKEPAKKALVAPKHRETFITRFLDIMLYDILHKLRIKKEPHRDSVKWEDYENWCRMVREGR